MWLLRSERGELFHIIPGKEHAVGRKSGGIIAEQSDQSLSRQHAKFSLISDNQNAEDGIHVIDFGSKYGTYVNDGIENTERIEANKYIVLKHGDSVRFGLQWNKFEVIFMPLIIITSSLTQDEMVTVKNAVIQLGGELMTSWSNAITHLVMSKITVNVKAVCALGAGKHIVTPAFLQSLKEVVESGTGDFPDPSSFVPPCAETVLNNRNVSFLVNPERANLFKSILFIVTTPKQMSRIGPMVMSAGGKVQLFAECGLLPEEMCSERILLLQNSTAIKTDSECSVVPDTYPQVVQYLSSKGYRCIPESDIGLSMVYCSREKFCNPCHNSLNVFRQRSETPRSPALLVPESQDRLSQVAGLSCVGKVINETVGTMRSPLSGNTSKRSREDASDEEDKDKYKVMCGNNQIKVPTSNGGGGDVVSDIVNHIVAYKEKEKNTKENSHNQSNYRPGTQLKDGSEEDMFSEDTVTRDKCKVVSSKNSNKKPPSNLKNRTILDMFASSSNRNKDVSSQQKVSKKQEGKTNKNKEDRNEPLPAVSKQINTSKVEPIVIDDDDDDDDDGDKDGNGNIVIPASQDSDSVNIRSTRNRSRLDIFDSANTISDDDDALPDKILSNKKSIMPSNSESFSFNNYSSTKDKMESKSDKISLKSVDMFDCSTTSGCTNAKIGGKTVKGPIKSVDMFDCPTSKRHENEEDDFAFPEDKPRTVKQKGNKLQKTVKKSVDIFDSLTSERHENKDDDDDDFAFPDERPVKHKESKRDKIVKSVDIFSSSTGEPSSRDADNFDFPDDKPINTSKWKEKQVKESAKSGDMFSSSSISSKSRKKDDLFDFPEDEPTLRPKRPRKISTEASEIFVDFGSLVKKLKKERLSTESDESDFTVSKKWSNNMKPVDDKENVYYNENQMETIDNAKVNVSNFICKSIKKETTDADEQGMDIDLSNVKVKVEADDDDDAKENFLELRDSSNVIVKPIIKGLKDLAINRCQIIDTTDSASPVVNYKRFKKNFVVDIKKLPKIIGLNRYVEEKKIKGWSDLAESSSGSEADEFDFPESQDGRRKTKTKWRK